MAAFRFRSHSFNTSFHQANFSVPLSVCIYLTEYDRMSASSLPCQWAEIDRRPGNLPSSRGLRAWQLCPPPLPGPHLMSHTVDTFRTLTHSHCLFLFTHFYFTILWERLFHRRSTDTSTSVCVLWMCRVAYSFLHPGNCCVMCIYSCISQDMFKCHNTDMSAGSVIAELICSSFKAFSSGL